MNNIVWEKITCAGVSNGVPKFFFKFFLRKAFSIATTSTLLCTSSPMSYFVFKLVCACPLYFEKRNKIDNKNARISIMSPLREDLGIFWKPIFLNILHSLRYISCEHCACTDALNGWRHTLVTWVASFLKSTLFPPVTPPLARHYECATISWISIPCMILWCLLHPRRERWMISSQTIG